MRARGAALLGRLATLLLAGLVPAAALAGGSRTWEIHDFRGLEGLDPGGAVVTADGGLGPGMLRRAWVGPGLPVIWKVAAVDGSVLAGGGDPAAVLRFDARGRAEVLLQLEQDGVTALAPLGDGRLAVGLTPGGALLTVGLDGEQGPRAETGSRYVWDMLPAGDGRVWIAAGEPGAVLLWEPGSPPRVVADLGADQARCLAPGDDGEVLVGTAGEGRVLAVAEGVSPRILLESGSHEVVSLARDGRGRLVAALADSPGGGAAAAGPGKTEGDASDARAGRVIRMGTDGLISELWADPGRHPLAVMVRESGEIWFGIGPAAEIRAVREPGRDWQVARLPARSLTDLAAGPEGVLAATGGLGTVGMLHPDQRMAGVALSPVHEAGPGARFGRARWWLRDGSGEGVDLSFRSGPTRAPGAGWGAWSPWRSGGEAAAPVAPPGRFVQWRARFPGGDRSAGELARVVVHYLPPNRPPQVAGLEVLPSGVVVEPLPPPPGQSGAPEGSAAAAALAGGNGPGPMPVRTRRAWRPGSRAVVWQARDPDGDPLQADVLLRADGEEDFLVIAAGVEDGFYNLDEARLPDGGYVVRVRVGDQAGNVPERSAVARAESPRFEVDRTPPRVGAIERRRTEGRWLLSFTVEDALTPPGAVRIALEDGALRPVLPRDGVEDELRETYEVLVDGGAGAPTLVVVEARDGAGNTATARRRFPAQE